jgi:hypothetical protein
MAQGIKTGLEIDTSKVIAKMKGESVRGKKQSGVQVGYASPYAVYVHERLDVHHENGQAKYLEQPARRLGGEMRSLIRNAVKNKDGLEAGLVRAGRLLLEASQALVPVDTGALKASGYVYVEGRGMVLPGGGGEG